MPRTSIVTVFARGSTESFDSAFRIAFLIELNAAFSIFWGDDLLRPGVRREKSDERECKKRKRNTRKCRLGSHFRAALGARKLLDCPVALLIFLSGTAGARIVAPDLWLAAHDGFDFAGLFTAGRGALIRPGKIHRRPARRAAPLQFVRRLFRNNL